MSVIDNPFLYKKPSLLQYKHYCIFEVGFSIKNSGTTYNQANLYDKMFNSYMKYIDSDTLVQSDCQQFGFTKDQLKLATSKKSFTPKSLYRKFNDSILTDFQNVLSPEFGG